MNKILSLSPKNLRPTYKTGDYPTNSTGKLPNIKERAFTIYKGKNDGSYNDLKEEDFKTKMQQKIVSFLEIQPPVNENKIALVKAALKNRNVVSPPPIDTSTKTEETNNTKKEIEICKNELDLQIKFLKDKDSLKKCHELSEQTKPNPLSPDLNPDREIKKKQLEVCLTESFFIPHLGSKNENILKNKPPSVSSSYSEDFYRNECNALLKESEIKLQSLKEKNQVLEQKLSSSYKENSKLNKLLLAVSDESLKLKEENHNLCEQINKSSEREVNVKDLLETQIKELNEDIEIKDHEFEVLREQLKRSENNRKRYLESIKDLETEFNIAKKKLDHLNKVNEDLQTNLKKTKNDLITEKEKVHLMEELKEEVESLKYELRLAKDENKEVKVSKDIAKESLDTVRKNFDCSRLAWKEKENNYEKMIENLMEQIQQEKAKHNKQLAETAKLKKALTLRDNDSLNMLQKEESSRTLQKIMQLDRENLEFVEENEKLKKNIEYFEFLVKNKEEIIQKLNEESLVDQEVNYLFTDKNLKKLKDFMSKWMICQMCNRENALHILHPCRHLLCGGCRVDVGACPKCLFSPIRLKVFTEVKKIREAYGVLSSISIE